MAVNTPSIPQNVVVHMGPPNSNASNVTVTFPDYIKNVASSEIYPTWPENALRANIYAIISFTLNRIYTEWYRSQGYNFDITSSTQYDQSFVNGRDVFENISDIVDEIFNNYVVRQGYIEPYFTQFCNGTTVTCDGLSQWGSVTLANNGYTPYQILQNYYGDNIDIVYSAPVRVNMPSWAGIPLSQGVVGNDVQAVQARLNRISRNYPSIPAIQSADGIYGPDTENAVREFQRIFSLPVTGVVNEATWYQIAYIYTAVKRLADLNSEGLVLNEVIRPYPNVLREGDTGSEVRVLQYFISTLSKYINTIPAVAIDGIFGPATTNAVKAIQREYGLPEDGIVGRQTWNAMNNAYYGIIETIPPEYLDVSETIFPGTVLREGFSGPYVRLLQEYLSQISDVFPELPSVEVTGYFGQQTRSAVIAIQQALGYQPDGLVGPVLWNDIVDIYEQYVLNTTGT